MIRLKERQNITIVTEKYVHPDELKKIPRRIVKKPNTTVESGCDIALGVEGLNDWLKDADVKEYHYIVWLKDKRIRQTQEEWIIRDNDERHTYPEYRVCFQSGFLGYDRFMSVVWVDGIVN